MKTKSLLLQAFAGVIFASSLFAAEPADAPPYPVWPIPQEMKLEPGRVLLTNAAIVVPEGDRRAQFPGRLLSELIADQFGAVIPVAVGKAPAGSFPILVGAITSKSIAAAAGSAASASDPGPEGYILRVNDDGALIAGCDYRGALYGVSTFIQLVHQWGKQSVGVRKAVVRDHPFRPVRWVHVYMPGQDMLPYTRRYMRDMLLRYKFNGLILEVGGGMRFDSHPEINEGWRRTVSEWYAHGETIFKIGEGIPLGAANRFAASCHFGVGGGAYIEKESVRQFAALAADYGLEIIPEIQSLSHAYYIASSRRDVAEIPEMPWPDSYCPSNPESYRILFDIMDEYIEVLHPKRVHIGHDEWRAGAFCQRCNGKDPGALFAQDVLKIQRHLKEKGIETWMWGDHMVDWHNRMGKEWSEGWVVRYELPNTRSARDILQAATKDLHILNWSGEQGDQTFKKLGWDYILGNFSGAGEKDWPGRVTRGGFLGGEVSTWGSFDEFQMGKLNIPQAAFSINMLWSSHYPKAEDAHEQVGMLLPQIQRALAAKPSPASTANPMRFEVLDIVPALNHGPKGEGWDLTGLKAGRGYYNAIPYQITDAGTNRGLNCAVVSRRSGSDSTSVNLSVAGRWASLIFLQSATGQGRETVHAGDATHFPRESSELLGFYEIRYADGLTAAHDIRFDENVGTWDAGLRGTFYFARSVAAGTLPDGRKAALWASEWTNPRPDVPIVSVKMIGTPGPSTALPVLFGVTGVEKPRVEDYR
jgi:hypothetical protein